MSIYDKDVSYYNSSNLVKPECNSLVSFHNEDKIQYPDIVIHECGLKYTGNLWNETNILNPFWRFYYNLEPGNKVSVKGKLVELGPDQIIILPAGLEFDCIGLTEVLHLWIHFSLEPAFAFHANTPFFLTTNADLIHSITRVIQAHESRNASIGHARQIYHTCAALLHSAILRIDINPSTSYPPALNRILCYIRDNPAADLSNAGLSRMACMSREGFIRWFTTQTNSSPGRYVTHSRIEYGGQLLALTERSIEDIAEACGFANRYYFTRIFSRHKHCGPAEFRKCARTT